MSNFSPCQEQDIEFGQNLIETFCNICWKISLQEVQDYLIAIKEFTNRHPDVAIPLLIEKSFFYNELMDIAYEKFSTLEAKEKAFLKVESFSWVQNTEKIPICKDEFEKTPQNWRSSAVLLGTTFYYRPVRVTDYIRYSHLLEMMVQSECQDIFLG